MFNDWAKFLDSDPQPWLAIDGNVIKGTLTEAQTPYQNWVSLVSVFGAKSGVVLGASSFESHLFSEIAVVPQLIEKLGLKGAVFTLDALHCQKKTIKSIYDTLAEPDTSGKLVPALAERWQVSEDALSWTFFLKKGVVFHNGDKLTARDV